MIWAALLLACGGEILVGYETLPCENWDFSSSESSFAVDSSATEITVSRIGDFQGCEDQFEPVVDGARGTVVIQELWIDKGGDCETCWTPTVHLYDLPSGDYEIFWFDDTSEVIPVWSTQVSL